ncbi:MULTISPECIES: SDR family oxidoreductase [Gordonia]|jgi:2,3-dihydro-2,3-dihydroxybenzoate dehydrogenase|uniref:SDR family oxidoreductase n=1 Tax=Gordonia TaxID=2053 RepID=UPI0032B5A1D1
MNDGPLTPVSGVAGALAVVTGAAGGIGSAVCAVLRESGATVIGWDIHRDPDTTHGDKHRRPARGGDVSDVDITDRDAVAAAWDAVERDHGPVDIVVSAAGVMSDDWDLCMAVNAGGVRNLLDVAVPTLVERRHGVAVVVSSNAGATPRSAFPAYAASKAAATSYARCIGLAAAPSGVRVNVVSPGSTNTPMLRGMWSSTDDRTTVLAGDATQFRLGIPLGRIAEARDIAETVVFLASDAARHITMHDLRVDGGATLDS